MITVFVGILICGGFRHFHEWYKSKTETVVEAVATVAEEIISELNE